MNTTKPVERELLITAFDRFEGAASQLAVRHDELQSEVERLERRLLDAHRRLEAVLDALHTGVAVVSAAGETVRANAAFTRMGFGAVAEDAELRELLGKSDSGVASLRVIRAGENGQLDLALTVVPVGDAEGTRVVTAQDFSEIRRQEEEGGRSRRLEALGRMAAELAHEVRNPLGSIRLFAGMLSRDLEQYPALQEMTSQILIASSSLESTVSNLLNFAAPSRTAMREVDLAAIAADTCALLEPVSKLRGVRVECTATQACLTHADPEGMRQVVLNLLGNSLAATGDGGLIRVCVENDAESVVLSVKDNGSGIASDVLPRVFDPFFTNREGGTGLGLSVVHRIVERHDGRIRLDSAPGAGTQARVEIPARVLARELP